MVDFENANSESTYGKNATIWLFSLVSEIWKCNAVVAGRMLFRNPL